MLQGSEDLEIGSTQIYFLFQFAKSNFSAGCHYFVLFPILLMFFKSIFVGTTGSYINSV